MESPNKTVQAEPLVDVDPAFSLGLERAHRAFHKRESSSMHASDPRNIDMMMKECLGAPPRRIESKRLSAVFRKASCTMLNVMHIDDYDLEEARELVSAFGNDRYGYLVTPNVDHVIRHYDDERFRTLYAYATYVLLDSRFLAHVLGLLKGWQMRVCLGSDLTQTVFSSVLKPDDVAILVGATAAQAEELRRRFGLKHLHHVDPPMNFIRDPEAVEDCLRQIEAVGPFRFCFLAVGSPQQEIVANLLQRRGVARGLALCVGASINFITGNEKRAPLWIQKLGCEWSYRLVRNPKRLAKRYLVRGPRIFWLLARTQLRFRRPVTIPLERQPVSTAEAAAPLMSPQRPAL